VPRVALLLALLAAVAAAGDFEEELRAAQRVQWEMPAWATWEERLNREYEALGKVGLEHHGSWQVHFLLGLNRAKRAYFARFEAEAYMARVRTQGADAEMLEAKRQGAARQIDRWLGEARDDFLKMRYFMEQSDEVDMNRILFGEAAVRFAGRRYLRDGQDPGAIEYFQELVRRDFLPDVCADHIALCYLDLGSEALADERFKEAQARWDDGLKWARQPALRQMLITNKAGGYEMDNEYALAEKLLREQIERDPGRPDHHKNLGLVLGYQGRLKEALYHYGLARELCGKSPAARQLSLLHGNAWLRAATIHGTLLEADGDVLQAWRLFMAYREMFGDDYNFTLWFGEFCASLGQYDLAWRFYVHARDLQPHCAIPYQKLTQIAMRTSGSREEVIRRVEAAKRSFTEAQKRYVVSEETTAVKRLCGGLTDLGDVGTGSSQRLYLDPDPLAGFDSAHPPPWVEEEAGRRQPFVPWEPGTDETAESGSGPGPAVPGGRPAAARGLAAYAILGAGLLVAALVLLLGLRGRGRAAA